MGGAKNCPETPRQKMIGMMYLVLTAMLALNVSTDILSGFTMVDRSLHSSIKASSERNEKLYEQFAVALEKNPAKTQEWYDKALKVRAKADSLFNYIQGYKNDLVIAVDGQANFDKSVAAGLDPTLNIQNNSDLDITGTYGLVQGNAFTLKDNVAAYTNFLTGLINEEKDGALAKTIRATLATNRGWNAHDRDSVDWEIAVFDGMPIGASMAVLSKMQNDVRTTEGQIVQYLMDQTDAGDVRVNKLNAYVIPNSNYVIRGGKYSAQIILAAVDTTQRPDYYVDGAKLNNEHGYYEVTATGSGKKSYSGYISITNDDEVVKLPFSSEYSVGEPAVTISNIDMNIMYRGYDNKFSVSVPGVSNDKVRVSVSGAPVRQQGGYWIITPGEGTKNVTISVQAELDGRMQPMGKQDYRVKQLPPPTAFFSAKEKEYPTGNIAASLLNKSGTIVASYGPDGLLDIPFTVTSFIAIVNGKTMKADGNKFTDPQMKEINQLKKGGMVILQDIRAKSPKGQELRLSPLVLTVN